MTEDKIKGTTMAVNGLNMIGDKTIEMEGKGNEAPVRLDGFFMIDIQIPRFMCWGE